MKLLQTERRRKTREVRNQSNNLMEFLRIKVNITVSQFIMIEELMINLHRKIKFITILLTNNLKINRDSKTKMIPIKPILNNSLIILIHLKIMIDYKIKLVIEANDNQAVKGNLPNR